MARKSGCSRVVWVDLKWRPDLCELMVDEISGDEDWAAIVMAESGAEWLSVAMKLVLVAVFVGLALGQNCQRCSEFRGDLMDPVSFLKENVDPIIKSTVETALKGNPTFKDHPKLIERLVQETSNRIFNGNKTESSSNYQFEPRNNNRVINSWSDLYHYLPHTRKQVAIWKARFIEAARSNRDKYKGCADLEAIAQAMIPSVEDVIADDRKHNKNLDRNYHRMK